METHKNTSGNTSSSLEKSLTNFADVAGSSKASPKRDNTCDRSSRYSSVSKKYKSITIPLLSNTDDCDANLVSLSSVEESSIEKLVKSSDNIKKYHKNNKLVKILNELADASSYGLDFEKEVIQSTLINSNYEKQIKNIVAAFNCGRKSIMTESIVGERIEPDEYRIVVKNNKPELVPPSTKQLRKSFYWNPTTTTFDLSVFKQTDLFIGGYGSFIINVPAGKIAKAWKGNIPVLFGPGPHVVHDANLKQIKSTDLVDMNAEHIDHGTYHILRIYPGFCAKIWINSTPYILTPRNKPYVFNHPSFIRETTIRLTSGVISHGNYNIIQVPKGKVAKVWTNSTTPVLLEENDEPYVFTDPTFKFDKKNDNEDFHDTSEKIIVHGSIKRIIPRTGEVAVTYNNGKLETFGPGPDNKPIIITSVNHIFDRFLPINIQTIQFPSEKTIQNRISENKTNRTNMSNVNYENFRTSDGLPIGVKILVIYEIENAHILLSRLHPDNILNHIENLVVADMGFVIQNCSSTDFLRSNQPSVDNPSACQSKDFYDKLQSNVYQDLKKDFSEYGIKLSRVNIETPIILDEMISAKIAEFSLLNSQATAEITVMDKKYNISKRKAEQEAKQKKIIQQQENDQKIAIAKAEYEAAKLKADAVRINAQAEADAQMMLLKVANEKAQLYDDHAGLLQYDMALVQSQTMKGISSMIVSPDVASMYFNMVPNAKLAQMFSQTQNK